MNLKSLFEKIFCGCTVVEKTHSPITALPETQTLVQAVKAKQGFKLPRKLTTKRLKACQRKPRAFSSGKLINGEILVTEDLFGNREMKVGKVTQSGGLVEKLWKKALFLVQRPENSVKNCLILGLGCGTVAKIISEKWPEVKMTGVEIDLAVVDVGKKYFGLDKIKSLKIIIGDALNPKSYKLPANSSPRFDLIIVDLYLGQEFPREAESNVFLNSLKKLLGKDGLIIFNRLNFGNHKKETTQFKEKLIKSFPYLVCREIDYNLILFASLEAQKKVYC